VSKTKSTLLAKQHKSHFQWWVGLIIVCVVAIAGIFILRFSRASGEPTKLSCTPTADTAALLNGAKVTSKLSGQPDQQCMTIAFLNRYTDYHKQKGNLGDIQSGFNGQAAATKDVSTNAASNPAIPKSPPPECSNLPHTTPSQSSYPVVPGTGEFKQPNKPGRQFTFTTTNWLGATGNCFYNFMNDLKVGDSIGGDMAWCAMFVSYVYAANGYPMQSQHGMLVYTVNQLVYSHLDKLVPNQLVLNGSYTPHAGDMVIYETNGDGFYDHVGIVSSTVEDPSTKQRFILSNEGNVRVDPNNHVEYVPDHTNIVGMRARALNDPIIVGYVRAPGNDLPVTGVRNPIAPMSWYANDPLGYGWGLNQFNAKLPVPNQVEKVGFARQQPDNSYLPAYYTPLDTINAVSGLPSGFDKNQLKVCWWLKVSNPAVDSNVMAQLEIYKDPIINQGLPKGEKFYSRVYFVPGPNDPTSQIAQADVDGYRKICPDNIPTISDGLYNLRYSVSPNKGTINVWKISREIVYPQS